MGILSNHFDKILLVGFSSLLLAMLLDLVKYHPDSSVIPWIEKSIDVVLGSLLTLITGQIFRGGTTTVTVPKEEENK